MYLLMFVCVVHFTHAHTYVIVVLVINSSIHICVSVAFTLLFSCERYMVVSRKNMYDSLKRSVKRKRFITIEAIKEKSKQELLAKTKSSFRIISDRVLLRRGQDSY